MTKTKTRKCKVKKGGFLGINDDQSNTNWFSTVSQNATDMWNNISQGTNDLWQKTKQTFQTQNQYQNGVGGKKTKKMRGGFDPYTNYRSIATNAAEFWQPTAKPQCMVGGKTKKNRKHIKSRKIRH